MTKPARDAFPNPFPGLRPFREDEEHLFFGRESQVDTMVDKLARTRFLAVVGTSGSGKSSLVNSGLRPAMHRGLMAGAGTSWSMAQFRPGANPMRAMARALGTPHVLFGGNQSEGVSLVEILEATLRMSKRGLTDIYEQARIGEPLLVVVDQFEELFRYRKTDAALADGEQDRNQEAVAFVNVLLEAQAQSNGLIYIVLTMRSDFLGDCAQFPGLAEAINEGQYLVPRLTRAERRAAISGPIAVGGAEISPVLLTRLVNDVGDNPDQLSILQHALNRTWARWRHDSDGPLSLPHYEAIGTMAHALDQHAEKAYAELEREDQQRICEKIFKALTDRGTDARGTRRPTSHAMLCALAGADAAEVTAVIDTFRKPSRSFLMPPLPEGLEPATVIDISHESLMRVWERLKTWADHEAQSAQRYRRLAETAAEHVAGKAGLLRDPELQLSVDWKKGTNPNAAWAGLYGGEFDSAIRFLAESEQAREKEQREQAARLRHELEQAQALAAERARSARRLRIGFAFAAILAVVAVGAAAWAIRQDAQAKRTSAQADVEVALMYRQRADTVDPRTIAHFARALRTFPDAGSARAYVSSLLRDLPWYLPKMEPLRHEGEVVAASFGADGRIVTASSDGTARIWDAESGRPVGQPLRHEGAVAAASFSPDGRLVVTGSMDGTARVWNAESGQPVSRPLRHETAITMASFSPDGRRMITASGVFGGTGLRVWDVERGEPIGNPQPRGEAMMSASFSRDGRRIVTASSDGTARVWDAATVAQVRELRAGDAVITARFSPNGRLIVTGSHDNTAQVWDVESGKRTGEPLRHDGPVGTASFSPDGRSIVTASWDGTARVWDVESGEPLGQPMRHGAGLLTASFSADGQRIVTASEDGTARVWDGESGRVASEPLRHEGPVVTASFSPDGRSIVTASRDKTARVWDAQRSPLTGGSLPHEESVRTAGFSTDGQHVITAESGGAARVWDARTGMPRGEPLRGGDKVWAASFSLDGRRIVTGSQGGPAHVWDAASGALLHELLGHEGTVETATFSTDGRRVVTASRDQTARIWSADSGKPVGDTLRHDGAVEAASFSPDGRWIVTASHDRTARVWDAESGRQVGDSLQHEGEVVAASFSPDGRWIVTASHNTARVWDARGGKAAGEPLRSEGKVTAASFSPDGQRIVTASEDGTAQVWNARSGERIGEPLRHDLPARAASFSANGRWIVTASDDRTVRLWDAERGKTVAEPMRHDSYVLAAGFSGDGRRIVTGSNDQTARVWDVAVDLEERLPAWVAELAEAVGGRRFNEQGLLVPSAKSIPTLRQELLALKGNDFWSRFGRWFFMRGPERTISPDSTITVGELERLRAEAARKNKAESAAR